MINRAAEVTLNSNIRSRGIDCGEHQRHFFQALVELIDEDDLARRATFPEKADIRLGYLEMNEIGWKDNSFHREISCHLAAKVFMQAVEEGLVVRINIHQNNVFVLIVGEGTTAVFSCVAYLSQAPYLLVLFVVQNPF